MKLKPLGDRLIVRDIEDYEHGVIVGGSQRPRKGKVVAVGDGKLGDEGHRVPLDVKEGDEIVYTRYGATAVKINGEDLIVMRESDVLGKEPARGRLREKARGGSDQEDRRLADLRQGVKDKIARLQALSR